MRVNDAVQAIEFCGDNIEECLMEALDWLKQPSGDKLNHPNSHYFLDMTFEYDNELGYFSTIYCEKHV